MDLKCDIIELFFNVIVCLFVFVIVKSVIKSKCDEARLYCFVTVFEQMFSLSVRGLGNKDLS